MIVWMVIERKNHVTSEAYGVFSRKDLAIQAAEWYAKGDYRYQYEIEGFTLDLVDSEPQKGDGPMIWGPRAEARLVRD